MKYAKQNDRKSKWLIVALAVACIVIGIQTVVIFGLMDRDVQADDQTASLSDTKEIALNVIETPVVDLMYHTAQVDKLFARVENDELCNIGFFAVLENQSEVELFRIFFGGTTGTKIGSIKDSNDKLVDVYIQNGTYDSADLTAAEINTLDRTRMDLIDNILSNMHFTELSEIDDSAAPDFVMVETPFADIAYRTNYQDNLEIQINDGEAYEVAFYCAIPQKDSIKLFTYVFGREEGTVVGYLNETPVSLLVHEPALDDTWSEAEAEIYYTMQEEMGHLIDELVKINGFTLETTNDL